MAKRISVIVSQGQSSNPGKRQLEEDIVAGLMFEPGFDVTVIPHLYDLKADSTGMLALKGISGDMIVCSWMFERAAHWILDRNQISGHVGTTLLVNDEEEEEEDEDEDEDEEEETESKPRVIDHREVPNRHIYCLDFKISNDAKTYIEESKRISQELSVQVVNISLGSGNNGTANGKTNGTANGETNGQDGKTNGQVSAPTAEQQARFENPENSTSLAKDGSGLDAAGVVNRIEEKSGRRWYPVIDYSRCTNCLECIDFCLFGVYGVDRIDTILVEQPDNCRKGCPACSRVCPENAIIFPQHKTPAIAGSAELGSSLKIDLSQLFGAPDQGKSADEIASQERDEQLLMAGRDAVGMQGLQKRQAGRDGQQRDELDDLVDQLDDMDL